MGRKAVLLSAGAALLLLLTTPAIAHWCSNIFGAYARLVVKPEKTTVSVPGTLKVYLQNNFPYKLFGVQMRGTASGYTINVSPSSQDVGPGQMVEFTYNVSGGGGSLSSSQMGLQVLIRQGGWQGESDPYVDPSPSQSDVVAASKYNSSFGEQAASLNAATLADLYPSATISNGPGYTGVEQLISWFGYRFCYNSNGAYRCGSQDCPSPCAEGTTWTSTEQFPQNCMRAGVDLGIRKAKLGSKLGAAQDGAVNAMTAGSEEHKCLAAVVGGHLWNGEASTTTFENALNSVSAACKAAGLRALGKGTQSSCTSGAYYEKAACAAAEGLRNNDGPVKSVLMASAGDGDSSGSYNSLYYAYMLYLVAGDRRAKGQQPSFYPAVGAPLPDQGTQPSADQGTQPPGDQGSAPPPGDSTTPPVADWPMVMSEGGVPVPAPTEAGTLPGAPVLEGGCTVVHGEPHLPLLLLLSLPFLLLRRR